MADRPATGLVVHQPDRGFRYGAEAFWLAGFALEGGTAATALDLGTGSGIVAFLLAAHGLDVTGVDVRPEWAPLWAKSLADSVVAPRFLTTNVRDLDLAPVDLVTSNPPYFPVAAGPVAPDPFKATARSEVAGTVADFVACAARHRAPAGRICFVVPVERADDVAHRSLALRRRVDVGKRRSLVELGDPVARPIHERIDEDDPRAAGWYARARRGTSP